MIAMLQMVGYHLIQQIPSNNTNKFYRVMYSDQGHVLIQWGRVGTQGQCKVEKLDAASARDIALRQVYAKAYKGYRTMTDNFKFQVSPSDVQRALDGQVSSELVKVFEQAQADSLFLGEKAAVFTHYDSFISKAEALMSRLTWKPADQLLDELAQLEAAFAEIDARHASAATTIALTKQMLAQKLLTS